MNQPQLLNLEEIAAPDIRDLVIEDNSPVDNFQSAKQQRLLVEPLYTTWSPEIPFIADSNIGLFYALKQRPIVPDAFLSLGVQMPTNWSQKQNRSYFVWEFGKVPDVCIEIVSNQEGNELTSKKATYARIGVTYYAVFDPLQQLQKPDELNGALLKVFVLNAGQYVDLDAAGEAYFWLTTANVGLTQWHGEFEEQSGVWLRWCDRDGQVILTGKEQAEREKQRADRLAERLRSMGIDPDAV